ncbi:hypothetical protein LAUMK41_04041 [Mycobacterium attenuatum]|nr:hypothetical protein LAUMK41_04041 [Mycobacterium attenuatum]
MSVPICPAVSYTVGAVKVLNKQFRAQKPQVMTTATPQTRSGSNPAGGTISVNEPDTALELAPHHGTVHH